MMTTLKKLKGFPERIFVADNEVFCSHGLMVVSQAFDDIDKAVSVGGPVEVGIYQLVRTAKFQKTAVEVKILKELDKQ